jgi:uncharacterized phage-like protein YoqJ
MQLLAGKFNIYANSIGGMGALKQNWDSFSFAVITCFNIMQKENWNSIIFQVA